MCFIYLHVFDFETDIVNEKNFRPKVESNFVARKLTLNLIGALLNEIEGTKKYALRGYFQQVPPF